MCLQRKLPMTYAEEEDKENLCAGKNGEARRIYKTLQTGQSDIEDSFMSGEFWNPSDTLLSDESPVWKLYGLYSWQKDFQSPFVVKKELEEKQK